MQLGFVLDMTRCIGCHACTVACKSENSVPLGDFRTWVKYTEQGTFPEVKRSFTVLRCNQCTDAPCVTICPVTALDKRPDGIVDIDHDICIGCKACMQGCPYDAIYLNEDTGTAEKCHFCAHRTEQGLAPACAVVCPTEAIVPGDFHDPQSRVSTMADQFDLRVRKPEAGTSPNVMYRDASPAGLDPSLTNAAGGFLWSQQMPGPQMDAELFNSLEEQAQAGAPGVAPGVAPADATARTTYDVNRQPLWGGAITGYLFFKSLAAGVFLAGTALLEPFGLTDADGGTAGLRAPLVVPLLSLIFLGATMVLLVADLKRPERFLKIMLRPNWNSWLAKGSYILLVYSLLLVAWVLMGFVDKAPSGALGWNLSLLTMVLAALSAAYTAWLFGQAKGRVLWMKRGYAVHLLMQALVAGSACLLAISGLLELAEPATRILGDILLVSLLMHGVLTVSEGRMSPPGREEEFARVVRLLKHGPYARRHWIAGLGVGVVLPLGLLFAASSGPLAVVAGVLALAGLYVEKDCFVRAGQALKIS